MNQEKELRRIKENWAQPGVHALITDSAQSMFFWRCFRQQQAESHVLEVPSVQAQLAGWYEQLSQSFLGATRIFWIPFSLRKKGSPQLAKKIIDFLNKYEGPHCVWLVLDADDAKNFHNVRDRYTVPAEVKKADILSFATFLGMQRGAQALKAAGLMQSRCTFTLDSVSSLAHHAQYVPLRSPEEARTYLTRLAADDGSLFELSDLFFQHQWKDFLLCWQRLKMRYADMFWVSFWSEQLWRAYWVCFYMQHGQQARARAMSYRLPRSFLQAMWKKQLLKGLLDAYEQLSFFDTRVKKGAVFTLDELLTRSMRVVSSQ